MAASVPQPQPISSTESPGCIPNVIFAISASHMSYDDTKLRVTALSLFAVALRAVKRLITQLGNAIHSYPLEIVILLVALCNWRYAPLN
jgi:hypothetical protein